MTNNDERHVGTNYFVQASNGKSLAMWRRITEELGDGEDIIVHVIDGKSGDMDRFIELLARCGRKSDVPLLTRDPNDYIQYAKLEALNKAYGKPVSNVDE